MNPSINRSCPLTFLTLPPEIRRLIYGFLGGEDPDHVVLTASTASGCAIKLALTLRNATHRLLQVCTQVRDEYQPLIYRHSSVELSEDVSLSLAVATLRSGRVQQSNPALDLPSDRAARLRVQTFTTCDALPAMFVQRVRNLVVREYHLESELPALLDLLPGLQTLVVDRREHESGWILRRQFRELWSHHPNAALGQVIRPNHASLWRASTDGPGNAQVAEATAATVSPLCKTNSISSPKLENLKSEIAHRALTVEELYIIRFFHQIGSEWHASDWV